MVPAISVLARPKVRGFAEIAGTISRNGFPNLRDMRESALRRFLRPRGLFLTAMIVVVAALAWRGAKAQREADTAAVAAWVLEAVRDAQADRSAAPAFGATEPVVAGALAAWVRGAMPAGAAGDARVAVTALGGGPVGAGGGEGTHRASLELRGSRAEVDVRWSAGSPSIVAFRADGPTR